MGIRKSSQSSLDDYILLRQIGAGGMAVLHLARPRFQRRGFPEFVVIKQMKPEHIGNPTYVRIFETEKRALSLLHHPNIIRMYDAGIHEGSPFLVLEHVPGKDLRELKKALKQAGMMLSIDLAVFLVAQVARGLAYVHQLRDQKHRRPMHLIHRDVSPQNIIVSFDGTSRLIDFGIAKFHDDPEDTHVGFVKGNPHYMSPEQVSGRRIDQRTDVFSLGSVLWELLCGRSLSKTDKPFLPSELNPLVPPALDDIVGRALVPTREERYPSAAGFYFDLLEFLREARSPASPEKLSRLMLSVFDESRTDSISLFQREKRVLSAKAALSRAPAFARLLIAIMAIGAISFGLFKAGVMDSQGEVPLAAVQAEKTEGQAQ